ncbi:MAG: periplasmic amidohydrolase [Lysobacteraceae bacterium]|nr:MAG: periplasmic amidohydrolase [Xanthomonadaceae bacterium]
MRPEIDLVETLRTDEQALEALRSAGFTVAHAVPQRGIWRGRGVLLSLAAERSLGERVLRPTTTQHAAFEVGDPFGTRYPGSLMGAVALVRQSLLDARWYAQFPEQGRPEANLALPALARVLGGTEPVWWHTANELDPARVSAVAREFGLHAVLVGNGSEYRVLDTLAATSMPVIAPLSFPSRPEPRAATELLGLTLAELQHWEQAPANPARLAAAGVKLALTGDGLDRSTAFWPALRKAVRAGLDEASALAALTTVPAELLGESARLGRIAPGQMANLLVADAGLFREDEARIYEVYVGGRVHALQPLLAPPLGRWKLSRGADPEPLELAIEEAKGLVVRHAERSVPASWEPPRLRFLAPADWLGSGTAQPLQLRLEGEALRGLLLDADGRAVPLAGERIEAAPAKPRPAPQADPIPPFRQYPAGAFGQAAPPPQPEALLIRGATVWTLGPQGVLEQADVLVRKGRIAEVGRGLAAPRGAEVVEAEGMHLTPGLVDAHSHTAVDGNVNEPTHAVTAEVRIGDVIDPTDISIYRQLAGGVTTALVLHGSANPIGGQSATLKWRWGSQADGLRFAGAPGGIKFALGENVKQSNWGDAFTTRYPQTRMGVEALMEDRFNAARAYAAEQAAHARRPRGPAPRRDLTLEALAEVLDGRRWVHIHSYRQDEILMFARLSQRHGFRVGTFTHILEGYKVADVLAGIQAGASTFADWWAYKFEVYDATPYNAALMHRQGVLVSVNSDSDEMARRLNTEAAKAMKYGGLSAEEALALVTRNPARQLGVGDRIGSIEPGKDADLVLWNGPPLSSLSRVEQTFIEGRRYFSRSEDEALRARDQAERERLLGRVLAQEGKEEEPSGADRGDADRPAPEVGTRAAHPAFRQLYHHGSDIVGCTVSGHHH